MISKSFWHGKSVLVTGGSSGIGRAIGLAAVASGSRVGIIARKRPPLEATLADLRARHGGLDAVDGVGNLLKAFVLRGKPGAVTATPALLSDIDRIIGVLEQMQRGW